MLVLTRCSQEEIRIGDDIIIRVLDVKGDRVRIGIAAPPEVSVHRQEVYMEIERTNRAAMNVAGAGLEGAKELLGRRSKKDRKSPHSFRGPKRGTSSRNSVNTEVTHGS